MAARKFPDDFLADLGIHYFEFPPGPEHNEEGLKYNEQVKRSQGYDVTSSYGRLCGGFCCAADLSDPSLQDIVRFAMQEYNKGLPSDKHLRLLSTLKFNYLPRGVGIHHYITLQAEDPSGNEKCYRANVYTCWGGCKWLSEFGLAPAGRHEFWKKNGSKKLNRVVNTQMMSKNEDGSATSVALIEAEKEREAQERAEYVKAHEAVSCRHMGMGYAHNTPSYMTLS